MGDILRSTLGFEQWVRSDSYQDSFASLQTWDFDSSLATLWSILFYDNVETLRSYHELRHFNDILEFANEYRIQLDHFKNLFGWLVVNAAILKAFRSNNGNQRYLSVFGSSKIFNDMSYGKKSCASRLRQFDAVHWRFQECQVWFLTNAMCVVMSSITVLLKVVAMTVFDSVKTIKMLVTTA